MRTVRIAMYTVQEREIGSGLNRGRKVQQGTQFPGFSYYFFFPVSKRVRLVASLPEYKKSRPKANKS